MTIPTAVRAAAELELRRRRANRHTLPETWDRWRADPFLWARDRLGINLRRWSEYAPDTYSAHHWDGTTEPLAAAAGALASGFSAAISSATGIGKTFLGAILTFWFLDCWEGSQVITTAPMQEHLTLHIWKEIRRLWPLFHRHHPQAELLTLLIRMRPGTEHEPKVDANGVPYSFSGWGAVGFKCGVGADEEVSGRARGFHATDMLFILEETNGIHPAILAAIKLTCTAPHNLRLFFGNPDHMQDGLALAAREAGVKAVRASGYDHPNVVLNDPALVPGAISVPKIEEWRADYGDESPLFQARARGIPPAQAADALIRSEWVEAAWKAPTIRVMELQQKHGGKAAVGVDVAASEDGDRAAIAEGLGAVCHQLKSYRCPDPNAFARQYLHPLLASGSLKPDRMGIDSVGVGVGSVGELKRLGFVVTGLNGGERFWAAFAKDGEVFANLRGQMWWQARQDLFKGEVIPPRDEELKQDLLAPKWWTQNGKIYVESKEDLKVRLGRSPDKGDAFVYWNWIRQASKASTFDVPSRAVSF